MHDHRRPSARLKLVVNMPQQDPETLADDDALITVGAACRIVSHDKPIHSSTYYRGVKDGIFPAPIKIGRKLSRVRVGDLRKALHALATDKTNIMENSND